MSQQNQVMKFVLKQVRGNNSVEPHRCARYVLLMRIFKMLLALERHHL